jgi:uncharacterized phage infection (PIP) family protein YhgE
MGLIQHKVLIVTGYDVNYFGEGMHFDNALKKAKSLFPELMSNVIKSEINEYQTFMIAPDGSKEGWTLSDETDKKLDEMVAYLRTTACKFHDGSSCLNWFLASYGEAGRKILKSNCMNRQ